METITQKPIGAADLGQQRMGNQFMHATNIAWAGAKRLYQIELLAEETEKQMQLVTLKNDEDYAKIECWR